MAGDVDIQDASVVAATGAGWTSWMERLDALPGDNHTARVQALAKAYPDLSSWWCQTIVVHFERERGLRIVGQSSLGDFQVSCSKTLPTTPERAWSQLESLAFVGKGAWKQGATWIHEKAGVEVRRCEPPDIVRFFLFEDGGRSTVEVHIEAKETRARVLFHHSGLPSAEAREAARARWKGVLAELEAAL